MPEIAAGLNSTQSGISSYVGQTSTPNQTVTFTISTTGLPTDTYGSITAPQVSPNKYTAQPTVWANSVLPGRFVYMVGLRGNGRGSMVYARIELQAKMRFRQTCWSAWTERTWSQYHNGYYVKDPKPRTINQYYYYPIYDYQYTDINYWAVLEPPTTRLWIEQIGYSIFTVTNDNYASPGALFNNRFTFPSANLKVSNGSPNNSNNYGGGYFPFGTYTFATSVSSNQTGTNYTLTAPNGTTAAQWVEVDGSFLWDETNTEVVIGVASDQSDFSATIDNWTAKDN